MERVRVGVTEITQYIHYIYMLSILSSKFLGVNISRRKQECNWIAINTSTISLITQPQSLPVYTRSCSHLNKTGFNGLNDQ